MIGGPGSATRPTAMSPCPDENSILMDHLVRASSVANHQQGRPIGRFYRAAPFKSRLLVSTNGPSILRIRIRHAAWRSFLHQIIDQATNEGRAVAASNHVGVTYEQVDASRAPRLRP